MKLFTRLVLLVLFVSVPSLVGLGLAVINSNRTALHVDADHFHLAMAQRIRGELGWQLEKSSAEFERLSRLIFALEGGSDEARLEEVNERLQSSDGFDFVTIYGPGGERRGTARPRSVAEPKTPTTLGTELRGTVDQPLRVGLVHDSARGPILELSWAVAKQDAVDAYLFTHFPLRPLCALLGDLGEAPPLRNRAAVYAVDAQRRLVLFHDVNQVVTGAVVDKDSLFDAVVGNAGFSRPIELASEFDAQGVPMLGALVTVPELGWAVVVQRPQAEAYASLNAVRIAVGLSVVLALALALTLGVFGARQVTRPLALLEKAVRRLGAGDFVHVDPVVAARRDEVGELGRAFDTMSGSLKTAQLKLVAETKVRSALSRYLPGDVVERVVADPTQLKLGGEKKVVTVLFADVVGFTRLAEALPPETIVALLNELFTFATEIIQRRGGIVDKFIGDCVMAVWGLPEGKPDDAVQAVEAAEELRRWVEVGNRRWQKRWGIEVQLAIGIHTGPAIAGNVGSEKRMEYTVVGDTVNIAARLEASAQPGQILVSDTTKGSIEQPTAELKPVGEQTLRGRTTRTSVFEVN